LQFIFSSSSQQIFNSTRVQTVGRMSVEQLTACVRHPHESIVTDECLFRLLH